VLSNYLANIIIRGLIFGAGLKESSKIIIFSKASILKVLPISQLRSTFGGTNSLKFSNEDFKFAELSAPRL
jgi:hypothetical protein